MKDFARDEDAAVAFEAVIITPILAWFFVASFVFFDAFRAYSTSLKATYAVADILSRQTEMVFGSDIDGLSDIFEHITRNGSGSSMRVAEVTWTGTDYEIAWAYATNGATYLRDSDLPGIEEQLPIMATGERVLVVETFLPYIPAFNMGIDDLEFSNFTITRPRFAGQVPFDDGIDPTCSSCDAQEGSSGDDGGGSGDEAEDDDEPLRTWGGWGGWN